MTKYLVETQYDNLPAYRLIPLKKGGMTLSESGSGQIVGMGEDLRGRSQAAAAELLSEAKGFFEGILGLDWDCMARDKSVATLSLYQGDETAIQPFLTKFLEMIRRRHDYPLLEECYFVLDFCKERLPECDRFSMRNIVARLLTIPDAYAVSLGVVLDPECGAMSHTMEVHARNSDELILDFVENAFLVGLTDIYALGAGIPRNTAAQERDRLYDTQRHELDKLADAVIPKFLYRLPLIRVTGANPPDKEEKYNGTYTYWYMNDAWKFGGFGAAPTEAT